MCAECISQSISAQSVFHTPIEKIGGNLKYTNKRIYPEAIIDFAYQHIGAMLATSAAYQRGHPLYELGTKESNAYVPCNVSFTKSSTQASKSRYVRVSRSL